MTDHPQRIDDAIVKAQPIVWRDNLTASGWSHCDRAMWLSLRNASFVTHKATTLRTFKMGHLLEDAIVEWLKVAEYKIQKQQAELLNKYGKAIGHIDGIIFADGKWHLLEIKTSNNKYFNEWIKKGCPDKYKAQAHIYMHHSNQLSAKGNKLNSVMFVVLNKDTSDIHIDFVECDQQYAAMETERFHSIIDSEEMPPKDETYQCAWCNHKAVCMGEEVAEVNNCRTCCNVTPTNGEFKCTFGSSPCDKHVLHPQLVEALGYVMEDIDHELQAIIYNKMAMAPKGVKVKGKATFNSHEFAIAHKAGVVSDEFVQGCKELLGAEVAA